MRTILINRFFPPSPAATGQIMSDLAIELASDGFDVHVITSRRLYSPDSETLPKSETFHGVSVSRIWTPGLGHESLFGRGLEFLAFYVFASWKLLKLCSPGDLIIVKSDPPLISVPAAWITQQRKAHLVCWLQDVFPEVAVAEGLLKFAYLARFLEGLRNSSLFGAELCVVLSQKMAKLLAAKGIPEEKIAVIANWANGTAIKPVAPCKNTLRSEWGLQNKFVVGYSGNLGRVHEVQAIRRAIEDLVGETNLHFVFIGGGHEYNKLRDWSQHKGFRHISFHPYQPRDHLSQSLSVPDVHLLSLKPSVEGMVYPSKLYGILAVGRPAIFIGAEDSDISTLLQSAKCGTAISAGDGKQLVAAIRELRDSRERETMGYAAREVFEQKFDTSIALKRWKEQLREKVGVNLTGNVPLDVEKLR